MMFVVLVIAWSLLMTPLLILLCLNTRRKSSSSSSPSINSGNDAVRAPLLASDQAPQTFVRVRNLVMRQSDARRDASIERAARQFNRSTDLRFVAACVQLGERPTVAHFRLIDGASRVEYLLAVHSDCARRPLFASARVPADRMRAAASVLGKLRMSGLLPVERVAWAADRDTLFMVVPLVRTGSLRDALRRLDPLTSIAPKRRAVGQPCASEPGPFFVDLLSTMRLLARIGVPLHHLHAGNVLINVDGRPWLDVSSSLLGEPPRYADLMRHFGAKSAHAKLRGGAPVDPAVVAFGAVVYEFYAGDEMESIEQIGNANLPPFVRKVLARIFLPNGEPPTLATLTDTFATLPGGVAKHRTYRDKTAQLDAADVELLAQACKAADAWVKRGGVDDATKGDIVVPVVDTVGNGKKHRSSSEKSSSGAPTTPRNNGDAAPRAKRKKKRPAYATGDAVSDDQSSLSATPVATPREQQQQPHHQV
jgi:hypothetical protein